MFAEHLFKVKLIDPCETAELTIDDSVFKTVPAVSLTQYVAYDALRLSWDDPIVSSTVTLLDNTSAGSLCGPLVHVVEDITSGTAMPLASDPFQSWTNTV